MAEIFNREGERLCDLPLSPNQMAALEAGNEVTVGYHTPRMLQATYPVESGHFTVRKDGERFVTDTPQAVVRCAAIQTALRTARGQ